MFSVYKECKEEIVTLKEIIEKCGALRVITERDYSDECVELVIYKEEMAQWGKILEGILGFPVKPEGVAPRKKDRSLTEDYGGITDSQVLFYHEFEDVSVIAMFWPWGDGQSVTLKMVRLENKGE